MKKAKEDKDIYYVEIHQINEKHAAFADVDALCFLSKNLWNYANYIVRQKFIETSKEKKSGLREHAVYLDYKSIRKKVFWQTDYRALPQKVANHVLMELDRAWRGFFASIKDWSANPSKYLGMPKMPGYLSKVNGRHTLDYELGAISAKMLKRGMVKLSSLEHEFKFINKQYAIVGARLVPMNGIYKLEIIYDTSRKVGEKKQPKDKNKQSKTKKSNENIKPKHVAGIDPGVNNLMALTFSSMTRPVIVNGRPLKSINQFYNKEMAYLQSRLPKGVYTSRAIQKLTLKRNNRINDCLHKSTTNVAKLCKKNSATDVVVGKNPLWKQNSKLSKKTNQNFVQIPFAKMISMLEYKLKAENINVTPTEEAYTSKCSFIDMEPLKHHDVYAGKRIHRGLFRSKNGTLINADVNGSYNQIRKVFPTAFNSHGIEGVTAVHPEMIYHFSPVQVSTSISNESQGKIAA